jgi:coproporphyrinogen III oxidase-like Fe-S oxidoreductase
MRTEPLKKILLPHAYFNFPFLEMKNRITTEKRNNFLSALQRINKDARVFVYVHIPFCKNHCAFCDFNKAYTYDFEAFLDNLLKEIRFYAQTEYIKSSQITAVHIGGGTPTLMPDCLLRELFYVLRSEFNLTDQPIHIEGDALSLTKKKIEFLVSEGVKRISFGVQSFDKEIRNLLNLTPTEKDILLTLKNLKESDIPEVGVDLMFGFPKIKNTFEVLKKDLKILLLFGCDIIDFFQIYLLQNQIEKKMTEKYLSFPSEDSLIDELKYATSEFHEHKYTQVNEYAFVKEKTKSILEASYNGDPEEENASSQCLALGPGAWGNIADFRYRNVSHQFYNTTTILSENNPLTTIDNKTNIKNKVPPILQIAETDPEVIEIKKIVLFPRVLSLKKKIVATKVLSSFKEKLDYLISAGYIYEDKDIISLTEKGKYYISSIMWYLTPENLKIRNVRIQK